MTKIYTVDELVLDDSFINYCHHSSRQDTRAWEEYLEKYPGELPTILEAKKMVLLLGEMLEENREEIVNRLAGDVPAAMARNVKRKKGLVRRLMPYAAAVLLVLASALIYFFVIPGRGDKELAQVPPSLPPLHDLAPGGNRAILTLDDQSTVILDSASNGVITQQGNIVVRKLENGLLAYTINGREITENDKAFYNTIRTPRGGQYQVTLSDGTKVWLNAASSLRFPVVFAGSERKVEITGEAYFEVARNEKQPFRVKAAASQVEVLGTHFNVNAYDDEASIKTTLLEGRVKVSVPEAGPQAIFLEPGQQAGIAKDGKINVLDDADTEAVVAWVFGRFQFRSADLKTILRQIARWYDADIVYKGNVDLHFTGQLTRHENVSRIFEKLALTGEVKFKVEGKTIIVSH